MKTGANGGFTFLEALLALTLFSIVAVSLYQTLRAGLLMSEKNSAVIRQDQRLRTSFDVLTADLANAVPIAGLNPEGPVWEKEKCSFYTIRNLDGGSGSETELTRVTYRFDKKAQALVQCCASLKEGFDEKAAKVTVLLPGLEGAWFDAELPPAFDNPRRMPTTVKIHLKLLEPAGGSGIEFEKSVFIPNGVPEKKATEDYVSDGGGKPATDKSVVFGIHDQAAGTAGVVYGQ